MSGVSRAGPLRDENAYHLRRGLILRHGVPISIPRHVASDDGAGGFAICGSGPTSAMARSWRDPMRNERSMRHFEDGNGDGPNGDCVCIINGEGGRLILFVADVAGHDAAAASFAADLRGRVAALGRHLSPGPLLTALNVALEASWPPEMFACAVCLSFSPRTGEAVLAVAGQLPPLMKRRTSCAFVHLRSGPALGLFADHRYVEKRVTMAPGEILVAVTDGVTDPLATLEDPLGADRLAALIGALPAETGDLPDRLLLRIHRGAQHDDASVLTVTMPTLPFDVFFGWRSESAVGDVRSR